MMRSMRVHLVAVLVALLACASTPKAPADKALVLGIKPGGPVELIIRSVDGVLMGGRLNRKPAYEVELDPGAHKLAFLCVLAGESGTNSAPTADLQIDVEAGRTYTLVAEPGGKQCIVRVAKPS